MKHPDPKLRLVELAYDVDRSPQVWLEEIGSSLRGTIPQVLGCFAFDIYREAGRVRLGQHWAEDSRVAAQLRRTFDEAPDELLELFYGFPLLARTTSEVLSEAGIDPDETMLASVYAEMDVADVFSVSAIGPAGHGAVLGMLLAEPGSPDPEARLDWIHVATHVAAGSRLRKRLDGAGILGHAEAILRPDGRLEHLGDPDAAELLCTAVGQIEYARTRGGSTSEALDLWQGLVDGRWSLVDHFDSDGRRFYVAVRNPPDAAESKALTRREAEVVAYLASGVETKVAAYALGLETATVRGHLRAAMIKLGVATRAELIGLRATLIPE